MVANRGGSHIGQYVLGIGFVLQPEQAQALIERDPRNREVLFPYLNGEDLNSRPDCSASRWVINFHDWPIERAQSYPEVFKIVERNVKPVRMANKRKAYRDLWWHYGEKQAAMLKAISGLDRVLVVSLVSKFLTPAPVDSHQVLSHKLAVLVSNSDGDIAFLNSSYHQLWSTMWGSSLESRLNYSPSDCFETLPRPALTPALSAAGAHLNSLRCEIMRERQIGLTKLYNALNDRNVVDDDIRCLRQAQVGVDLATADAYGWSDLSHDRDFRETRQGLRYSVNPEVRIEILDRLFELNHTQHANETNMNISTIQTIGGEGSGAPGATHPQPEDVLF